MTTNSCRLFPYLFPIVLASCALGSDADGDQRAGDAVPTVSLSGADLHGALQASEVVTAPVPFERIAVALSGDAPDDVEIATSPDGSQWSRWRSLSVHHSELESRGHFAGDVWARHDEPGRYYMLRSRTGAAVPASLELRFFSAALDDDIEVGDPIDADVQFAGNTIPFNVGAATVNPRSAWSARAARCQSGHTPRRITIHHTEQNNNTTLSAQALVRSVQSYHQNTRGWCDIGYHFLVSKDGQIWEGRPTRRLGAHAGAGHNTGNIGIALMGNHVATPANEAQLAAVGALIRGLSLQFGIPIDGAHIKGHRDHRATACPGDELYAQLDELMRRASGGEAPVPVPESGDVRLVGAVHRDGVFSHRLADATVVIDGQTVAVDEFGLFDVPIARGRTATIEVSAPGYQPQTFTRTATTDPTWASIGLVEQGAASGSAAFQGVIYTGGDPTRRVGFAEIEVEGGRTGIASWSGYYRITGLAPGTYRITARAPGYEASFVTRATTSGAMEWASVELSPSASGDGGGSQPAPSCADSCGSGKPLPGATPECYCDAACKDFGDCCDSYYQMCE